MYRPVALSDRIDEAAGYCDSDHAAVKYTERPKGIAGPELGTDECEVLRTLLGTYIDRVPEGISPSPSYDDAARVVAG